MNLFAELNQLMIEYRFKPNRKLSQHFIVDEKIIEGMVKAAELTPKDIVLEIGAGTGFLTKALLEKGCKVIAVEKDPELCELLRQELPQKNLTVIEGDFLEVDVGEFNKVVCFPPYLISAKIVDKLISHGFDLAVLCFQLEFIEKLLAVPGMKEYSAIAVLTQYHCVPEPVVQKISPKSFFPSPEVFSSIVKLTAKEKKPKVVDEEGFALFVRELFRLKNKDLSNALSKVFSFLKTPLKLNEKEFNKKISGLKLREEKVNLIEVEEFAEIFNQLAK